MNKELKKALATDPEDLTSEQKALIQKHWATLADADKTKFAEVAPKPEAGEDDEDEEEVDEKAVMELIQKTVESAIEKKVDKISDDIVSKFFKTATEQRKKAIDSGKAVEGSDKEKNEITRTFLKALLAGDKARLKALTTNADTTDPSPDDAGAGQLIPTVISNEVLRIASDNFGLARRDMFYLPFTGPGNSRTIPALGTSVTVYWTDEGQKKKSTQPKFNVVVQTLKKLAAIVPMTEEIIEDSGIDLMGLVSTLLAEAMAKEEDVQFFNGTGTPWTGILNNASVNKVTMTAEAATGIDVEWLQAMIDATPSGALAGAKFYMHRTVLSKVRLLREGGATGAYIFTPATQGNPQEILGYPVETSDAFPTLAEATNGVQFVLFGNLKQGAVFGDKQQMRVKLLDQATIADTDDETVINLAEQDMVALRVVERVGYVVAQAKALTVLEAGA